MQTSRAPSVAIRIPAIGEADKLASADHGMGENSERRNEWLTRGFVRSHPITEQFAAGTSAACYLAALMRTTGLPPLEELSEVDTDINPPVTEHAHEVMIRTAPIGTETDVRDFRSESSIASREIERQGLARRSRLTCYAAVQSAGPVRQIVLSSQKGPAGPAITGTRVAKRSRPTKGPGPWRGGM